MAFPSVENSSFLYQHTPLQPRHVRLLQIQFDQSSTSTISCSCLSASLDDPNLPDFVALSYTWGEPTPTYDIKINGKRFRVRDNLYHFLTHAQASKDKHRFWIDAICINQSDNNERSKQVMLMAEIYSRAVMVQIWLGEATEDTATAMSFVEELQKFLPEVGYVDFETLRKRPESSPGSKGWLALGRFTERPWFSRIWVIQEIALASRAQILCGNHTLSWELFENVTMEVSRLGLTGCAFLSSTPLATQMGHTTWNDIGFIQEARDCIQNHNAVRIADTLQKLPQYRKAGDLRDKIYGLLGIVSDANDLIPDYDKSVPDLYTDVARYILLKDASVELLLQAGVGVERSLTELPSWVPDYSTFTGCERFGRYKVSGATQSYIQFDSNFNTLHTRGIVVDAITRVGTIHGDPRTGIGGSLEFFNWVLEVQQSFNIPKNDEELFWRTIIANRCDLAHEETPGTAFANSFKTFMSIFSRVRQSTLPLNQQHYPPSEKLEANIFRLALCYATFGRRFCTSREGSMGLVPAGTREGDLVCILYGACVPFLIRAREQTQDREQEFELVGECYLHGIMDGEAMALDYEVQDIYLV